MTEILRQKSIAEPEPIKYQVQPLTTAQESEKRAPFQAPEDSAYWRYLGSAAQNSRLQGVLGNRSWQIRWSYPALPSTPATAILRKGNRILTQYQGGWTLLDAHGTRIASGTAGRGALSMDPHTNLFYLFSKAGAVEARQVTDGELQFQSALPYDESYAWPLVFRDSVRLVAFGNEMPVPSHQPVPPREAIVQLVQIGSPVQVDRFKLLKSVTRFESLHVLDPKLIAAASGDTVYAAGKNLVLLLSTALEVKAAYSGQFEPLLMSVDESGWMYIFAGMNGRRAVVVITPEGKQVQTILLNHEDESLELPPIVGYDHRIYLLTSASVVAYSPEGRLLWRRSMPGRIAGAGVTLDGTVLVTAGSQVSAVHPDGGLFPIFRFEGEELVTPPVYTSDHEILAGTRTHVYCLSPAQ